MTNSHTQRHRAASAARGMTMMEVIISMAVLSFGFLLAMQVLQSMTADMYVETMQSDLQERSSGRVYQMIADLQSIMSSDASEVVLGLNLIEKNPSNVPTGDMPGGAAGVGNSIRFRICSGVDAEGRPVFAPDPKDGAVKIRYRWLSSNRETPNDNIDNDSNGIVDDGYILMERLDANNVVVNATSVEDHIPARVTGAGREPYGFTIERKATNMRELYVTVQRAGDQRKATDNGTLAVATVKRKIFLVNK